MVEYGMKVLTLREFQLKPSKYLDSLPLTLTKYGRSICCVVPCNAATPAIVNPTALGEVSKPKQVIKDKAPKLKAGIFHPVWFGGKSFQVCEHGNESGQCPQGCIE